MKRRLLGFALLLLSFYTIRIGDAAPFRDFNAQVYLTESSILYTEPTSFRKPIARLLEGLKLEVLHTSTKKSWLKVRTPTGREGWVPVAHTSPVDLPSEIKRPGAPRAPASVEAVDEEIKSDERSFGLKASVEYANQVNVDKAHGLGLGAGAAMKVNELLSIGAGLYWDWFRKTTNDTYKISRSTHHILLGPSLRVSTKGFFAEGVLGWDYVRTSIRIRDSSGNPLPQWLVQGLEGSFNDNAVGLRVHGGYEFPIDKKMKLELSLGYAIGFHGGSSLVSGEEGVTPQQLMLGVGLNFEP